MASAVEPVTIAVADEGQSGAFDKKLRIGVFTESYPPVVNGVTTSVLTLINQLETFGHDVFVFSSEFPGYKGDTDAVVRVPAVLTPFDKAYPIPLPLTPRILKSVREMELDLIHTQSPFLMGVIAQRVARLNNVPLIATNHTIYSQYVHYVPFTPQLVRMSAHVWIGWYYSRCDAVITPSNFAASRLRSEYNVREDQIAVIPSGIPIPAPISDDEKTAVRKKYGIPLEAPILTYAGRMAQEKNLPMLLDACERVIFRDRPDAFLLLAGAGMHAQALRETADQSEVLKNRVILTGFLPRAALDPIYAGSTILAFPSLTETQGMVLGEAMAVGTPCVAVNVGGAPETVCDGVDGMRVENDPVAFGNAIVGLLNDPSRLESMRAAAVRNAESRTPQKMGEKVLDVYHRALARRSGV